jgi:hypothetical protein
MPPGSTIAPYAVSNAFMQPYTQDHRGQMYTCQSCRKPDGHSRSSAFLVTHTPEYMRALLSLDSLRLQSLAVLDATPDVVDKYRGFAEGSTTARSLLGSPLLAIGQQPEWLGPTWTHIKAGPTTASQNSFHNPILRPQGILTL